MKRILLSALLVSSVSMSAGYAGTIEGTGASFPYPVYKAWLSDYHKATGNQVNYSPTGSGTGIKEISARHVDFGGSDKPLKPKVLARKKLYMFPTVVGAITFAYNVPGVNQLKLSEAAISGILLGNIEYWDAATLKKDNPGAKLPHKKILFVHRSDKSGTTFNFTYYLSKMNSVWRRHFGAKKAVNWPMKNRIAGKGNYGVSAGIKTNDYSIGYVDYADAIKNGLKMATIEDASGQFVKPEPAAFVKAAGNAKLDPRRDFYAIIAYPKKGYPIVAATFILLPKEKAGNDKKVTEFFDYSFKHGDTAAQKLGYVPLPQNVKNKIRQYWSNKGIQ